MINDEIIQDENSDNKFMFVVLFAWVIVLAFLIVIIARNSAKTDKVKFKQKIEKEIELNLKPF